MGGCLFKFWFLLWHAERKNFMVNYRSKTIGSYIFYLEFLNFIAIILFIYFVYQLSSQLNLKNQTNNFLYLYLLLVIFIYGMRIFGGYSSNTFSNNFFKLLNNKSINSILFLSFLSVFTFFWSLDRGFFVFLVYIFSLLLFW